MIDEVDKSTYNQLFLDFLGMLRTKYLKSKEGKDSTFHSDILSGVHDIKTLKLKIRGKEEKTYNSPWNIAHNLKVDLTLTESEICSMLESYARLREVDIDIAGFADRLFYLTSGYPFLVSYLCKIIDEEIAVERENKEWLFSDLMEAVKIAFAEDCTNFQSLTANLENNQQLSDYLERQNLEQGYLLIYDLRKEKGKTGRYEKLTLNSKTIFAAWV